MGYDKWQAKSFASEMSDYGFDMVKIVQDPNNLSSPMKLLEADLKSNLVNYNQNEMDIWCLKNTSIKTNDRQQVMPIKVQDSRLKHIDGAVTMIICYATLNLCKKEYQDIIR